MYHTFQTSRPAIPDGETIVGLLERPMRSRRISTSNACSECRRRKIRCDGSQPCGQCQWYQHPQICTYSKPTQRIVPSRKLVDNLQNQVDRLSSILSRMFPGEDLETLMSLPREELINLALTAPAPATSLSCDSETTLYATEATPGSDGADSLEALEQAPDQDPETDEATRHEKKVQGISDDVNGLSLSVDKQSSYVGISSITAALKVIFKTAPIARPFVAQSYTETAFPSRSNSPKPKDQSLEPDYVPPMDIAQTLIDSYFVRVHALMPMVDETHFRQTYLYAQRKDSPWLALLNVVLALGSLARSTCDDEDHITYFQRCRKHLELETFGSGNLLILQALGLLSGYYLHWLNRPNEANSLMGATLRMATALGLHREYGEHRPSSSASAFSISHGTEVPADIRRRTFWSLYCLDTWAYMTTGRPSLGRLGPGITVQSPKMPEKRSEAEHLASVRLLPIIHNIAFCKIATRIQDKLAGQPLLKTEDLSRLDAELVKWHDALPTMLRADGCGGPRSPSLSSTSTNGKHSIDFSQPPGTDNAACPEALRTPRAIMHWWYLTVRMLMHRPYLLTAALRRSSHTNMSAEENLAVSKCRVLAGLTIENIDAVCPDNLIAGWNAVWLMYQAVMVPLVSLFSYLSSPAAYNNISSGGTTAIDAANEDADKWRHQIETAVCFFDRMQRYSVAAKKSRDVVTRLYDASKHVRQYHEAQFLQQQAQRSQQQDTMLSRPSHPVASEDFALSGFASTVPENEAFDTSFLDFSPLGDAAMDDFWDDMMWDTIPSQGPAANNAPGAMPGSSELGGGLGGEPNDLYGYDVDWATWGHSNWQ